MCIYVYVLYNLVKTQGETEKYTHRGALSIAPFHWLSGQLGRQRGRRGERLRQTGDILGKDKLFKSLTKNWKNQVKNK